MALYDAKGNVVWTDDQRALLKDYSAGIYFALKVVLDKMEDRRRKANWNNKDFTMNKPDED